MSFDVFKEAESGLEKSNSPCDVRPKMARIFFAKPFSCG